MKAHGKNLKIVFTGKESCGRTSVSQYNFGNGRELFQVENSTKEEPLFLYQQSFNDLFLLQINIANRKW
jgi:hypothetical protein